MRTFTSIRVSQVHGFTLIEILAVVAVLGLLMGLALPVLGKARESGQKAAEVSAARALITAFQTYASDNGGYYLPGYQDPGRDVVLRNDKGGAISDTHARSRYAWRIAPYVDYDISGVLLVNNTSKAPAGDAMYDYKVSVYTTLGMNTTFVGGDYSSGARLRPDDRRTQAQLGNFCVQNIHQAIKPSSLIVFASAGSSMNGRPEAGRYAVDPLSLRSANKGHLDFRYGGKAVVACLGGNVEMISEEEALDMRRWANGAAEADNPNWAP